MSKQGKESRSSLQLLIAVVYLLCHYFFSAAEVYSGVKPLENVTVFHKMLN